MSAPRGAEKPRFRLEDFDIQAPLAKGSFGVVYKAVRKADGRVYALKQVNLAGMKRAEREESIDEARILAQLNHPYVTRHYDSYIDGQDRLNIFMEFASKGNLNQVIKDNKGRGLPEDLIWKYSIQALLGLNYIHSKRLIHRDIKALNLFLDSNDNIKIGDLGIARALSTGSLFASTIVGTPYYLSPELCEDKPYNAKSDVWALGVVMYELCMGTYPFEARNEGALIRKILRGQYTPISGPYTPALIKMVSDCLTFDYNKRPDTTLLLRNPNLVAKAKALNIDLNPKLAGSFEDRPVYEGQQQPQLQVQPPYPDQQQQQYLYPPSPGGGGYAPQYQQQQYPGQQQPYPPQQYQQQQYPPSPGGNGYVPPGHPFAAPAARQNRPVSAHAALQQPRQQQPAAGMPYPNAPPGHPFAHHQGPGGMPYDPFDRLADDVHKMQLRESEFHRVNQERQAQLADNMHRGQKDNLKGLMYAGPQDSDRQPQRLRPEDLPAAGARAQHDRGAPFALHGQDMNRSSREHEAAVWSVKYSPPQYGRKRNPDLQITGPSLRGAGAGARPGSARYAPAADDATSYVSSSYVTSYYGAAR